MGIEEGQEDLVSSAEASRAVTVCADDVAEE